MNNPRPPTPTEKIESRREALGERLSQLRLRRGDYGTPAGDEGRVLDMPGAALARAHRRLDKRKKEIREDFEERRGGPQGEKKSAACARVEMVDLENIVADNDFRNLRVDPPEEVIATLAESMNREGLKIPVTVVEAPEGKYFLRAGFKRVRAARRLGWTKIPATVLPADTPEKTEYWTNIIENFARTKVHPYETAVAAKTMRDKFGVGSADFAARAGFDVKYVDNLLHAADHLPDEILLRWKEKRLVPTEYFVKWSYMTPEEAVRSYHIYAGLHPRVGSKDPPTTRPRRAPNLLTMATREGLRRMERVHFAAASSLQIRDEETRKLLLETIEFCLGQRTKISYYDDEVRHRSKKGRDGRRSRKVPAPAAAEDAAPGAEGPAPSAEALGRAAEDLGFMGEETANQVLSSLRKDH